MTKRMLILLAAVFLVAPLIFFGCGDNGSTGPAGPAGATGATGATGPAGPTSNSNESCTVCHTTGRIADITDASASGVHYNSAYHKADVTVDTVVVGNVGGVPTVSFHVTSGGNPVTTIDNASVRFMMADMVPAGTVAGTANQSTPQFELWAYERVGTMHGTTTPYPFGTFDTSGAASGNYAYTFAATGFGAPDNTDIAPDYSATHVQRVYIGITSSTYNNAAKVVDFNVPAAGATTTGLAYVNRQFVTIDACRQCHGPLLANAAHGGSYVDTLVCVLCHSPIGGTYGAEMTTDGAWLASLVHQIHADVPNPAFAEQFEGEGFGAVTYPQDIRNCTTCHTDSGLTLGAGDNTANWESHPSAAACSTCHVGFPLTSHQASTVYATDGTAHPGGTTQPDSACATCHPTSGPTTPFVFPVATVHDTSPEAGHFNANDNNVPEFDVDLTLSPVQAFYVAGDNVTVTATLTYHGTSTAVPASVYTSGPGAAQVADNVLSSASLYIYGPRAEAKPIFAPTDNTQAHSLFAGATDRSGTVGTDGTGFRYSFTVPSGLANGTYMIRARFADFGYNRSNPGGGYRVESYFFRTFQIGSATVTAKVAGDCTRCHASEEIHINDHVSPFDSDQCLACHDYSGGHAAVLSNRVHAVHSANSYGDMNNALGTTSSRNWDDVTYPVQIDRCTICHSSGNADYRSVVGEVACLGCHGDNPTTGGATNHMLQNGGMYPEP